VTKRTDPETRGRAFSQHGRRQEPPEPEFEERTMSTQQNAPNAADAKSIAVRMFFQYGMSAADVVRARREAAERAGDGSNAALWASVLAAIDAAPEAAGCAGFDAMLACWKRLRHGPALALVG
jgi:hypothetical protein